MNTEKQSLFLSEEQISSYQTDGFLFIPELFTPDEVDKLKTAIKEVLTANREEVDKEAASDQLRCAFACHTYNDIFHRLSRHPRIVEPVRHLLGGEIYMHQFSVQPKVAFEGEAWDWHQDYSAWKSLDGMPDTRAVNTGLLIDEVNEFNGPLYFIPGSHRHGLQKSVKTKIRRFPAACLENDRVSELISQGGLYSPKGPAGSLWIFHPNLVHASSANMSPWNRTIITQCYAHVHNGIQSPTRPEWVAHTDCTPVTPMGEDCLLAN
jgi:ectoine hydroxylase